MGLAFFGATSKSSSVTTNNTSNTTDAFNTTNSRTEVTTDAGNTSITVGPQGVDLASIVPWVIVIAALWGALSLLKGK